MRTSRVTVLMRPEEKASLEASAAKRGLSSGEYIRLAVSNFDTPTSDQEAELAALAKELGEAASRIRSSLEKSCRILSDVHAENDAFFHARGIA